MNPGLVFLPGLNPKPPGVFRRVKLHHFLAVNCSPFLWIKAVSSLSPFRGRQPTSINLCVKNPPKKEYHGLDTGSENFKRSMGCAKN